MSLNKAQLMAVPGGPGVTGAVKAGTGIAISGDGTISLDPTQVVSRLLQGNNITLTPATGVGAVTISAFNTNQGDFPVGTVTVFVQASAPSGWAQVTSQNNKAMRVVGSTGGGTGGSAAFTTVFTSVPVTGTVNLSGLSVSGGSTNTVNQTPSGSVSLSGLSIGATSISQAQMPSHTHTYQRRPPNGNQGGPNARIENQQDTASGATGGNQGHTHSASGNGSFSGNSLSHSHNVSASVSGNGTFSGNSLNLAVQYIDAILCSKA